MGRFAPALIGALCLLTAAAAPAAEFTPYVFSRPVDQPRGSVGLQLRASGLEFSGDVTAETRGSETYVAPKFLTRVALAPKLSMETRLDFAGWNGRAALLDESAVETKFRARAPLPMVREIVSSFWRGADGLIRQRIGIGFVENLGLQADSAWRGRFNTRAIFEQTVRNGQTDVLVSGLEASLSGFATGAGRADSRLSLRYETREGVRSEHTGSLAYHRGWRVNEILRLTVDCEVVSSLVPDSRVLLGWHAEF